MNSGRLVDWTARVCLFVWGFSSHSRIFHSFEDVTIAGEGLQILTYARHSWPLSSEGSWACNTYCHTGHLFIMVISKDSWHSHLMPSVLQWSCHLGLRDSNIQHSACGAERSNRPRRRYGRQSCPLLTFNLSKNLTNFVLCANT